MADRPSEESSAVPDDVWEKFARDSERDISASAPKEPSARARTVTRRLREQDARGQLPEGWRTGPAWREMDGRATRRGRWWSALGVLAALAVVVVALRPSLLPGDPFGTGDASDDVATTRLPDETAAPTAPPEAVDPDIPTRDRPFAGSPALRWADGADGIVVPEAKAVGVLTEAQVAKALKQTKVLLTDANLAPATLRGERPEAALDVIEPTQTELLDLLDTALREPDEKHDPLGMFTRFDPGEVRLAGDVVKTRGRMTFEKGKDAELVVHADYTFVYPLVRTGEDSTEVARTIIRRVLDVEVYDPARYRTKEGGLVVERYDLEIGNSACDVHDGYLHPQFATGDPVGSAPTGPTTDPYDRSRELAEDRAEECGTVSRT
ncbi:hypothetical protein [Streptomyces sp. NPDC048002]|uniref:hypothetical protein n=1 Tax=Streptomyces sp. NPDC048002 TaxID=3154344 RepID=UPI0033E31001